MAESVDDNDVQQEVFDDRIWIDGCFDFSHHGHAGAMLQARRLGTSLHVGIHSDEEILANKGPTVMNLEERCAAADACRWSTVCVPNAPYVTYVPFISQYGCKYVVHGDDITSDSGGEDCYRFVKQAGRFKVVKRAPGISTTDLVGRMLLCTKSHFINNIVDVLTEVESQTSNSEARAQAAPMRQRLRDYATDESGNSPLVQVDTWTGSTLLPTVAGIAPLPGQRTVYADGGFDLFTPGHIEFLRKIVEAEEHSARIAGWYGDDEVAKREAASGKDYSPVYLVVGIHDDNTINHWKGVNYPIMNIFERGLCVLQCKYVSAVVFGAPFEPTEHFLKAYRHPLQAVYHGPLETSPGEDPYRFVKALGLYREIPSHKYANIDATEIAQRIMKSRDLYEERQRAKGVKGIGEEAVRRREELERQQAERTAAR